MVHDDEEVESSTDSYSHCYSLSDSRSVIGYTAFPYLHHHHHLLRAWRPRPFEEAVGTWRKPDWETDDGYGHCCLMDFAYASQGSRCACGAAHHHHHHPSWASARRRLGK